MEDCSTDKRLRQKTLCHRQWTDEYVERPETLMRHSIIVDWIQCLLENKRATVKINKPTEFWTLASPCQLWGTGACAPVNFQLSNFSGHFRAAQPLGIRLHVVDHAVKLYTRLFVTVYCMNFITFLCAILNYFLVSCPSSVLAPNPGDSTDSGCRQSPIQATSQKGARSSTVELDQLASP